MKIPRKEPVSTHFYLCGSYALGHFQPLGKIFELIFILGSTLKKGGIFSDTFRLNLDGEP